MPIGLQQQQHCFGASENYPARWNFARFSPAPNQPNTVSTDEDVFNELLREVLGAQKETPTNGGRGRTDFLNRGDGSPAAMVPL